MFGFVDFLLAKQEDDTKSLIALTRVSRNCLGGLACLHWLNYSILHVEAVGVTVSLSTKHLQFVYICYQVDSNIV